MKSEGQMPESLGIFNVGFNNRKLWSTIMNVQEEHVREEFEMHAQWPSEFDIMG